MLLKTIHTVKNEGGNHPPGSILDIEDMADVKRLIEVGAAVPIRKKVTISFSSEQAGDDFSKKLMDDRRESEPNKTIIDGGCEKDTVMSSGPISEGGIQPGVDIGSGALNSLDARVHAESGGIVDNSDGQPVFAPNHEESIATAVHRISCATGLPESDVERRVQDEIENQGSLLPGHGA